MSSIQKLPTLLINQIAAGEVIERPASVVKELAENAIDAGAKKIDIAIEQGGRELIRITDNGHGIPPDQLHLALAPHATSKISQATDLDAIGTLGFRGEALASIVSISRMTILSRTADQESAYQIESEGEEVGPVVPTAGTHGTTITVRNLFFNTPARRKFLRTVQTEYNHIAELVRKLALSHPAIGFTLTHNNRKTGGLDLPPDQSPNQRILAVLGKELSDELMDVSAERGGAPYSDQQDAMSSDEIPPVGESLWGMIGTPAVARGTAKNQYVFLNGRSIRDKTITHAIKEAYRGLIDPTRHPMVVLYIEIDPSRVDVNVHPAKTEIRFRDSQAVHGLVLSTLRQRLLAADLTRAVRFESKSPSTTGRMNTTTGRELQYERDTDRQYGRSIPNDRMNDRQSTGFSFHEAKDTIAQSDQYTEPIEHRSEPLSPAQIETDQSQPETPSPEPSPVQERPFTPRVLQVHNSYLVVEEQTGIVIIDQHALHERVMFEDLKRRILGKKTGEGEKPTRLESQHLLMPVVMEVSPSHLSALEWSQPLFNRIGIEVEQIGPGSIAVHAFPTFLFERRVDPGEFVSDVLDFAVEHGALRGETTEDEAILHKVLDMMACKAAVKAGDSLTREEIEALLQRRDEIERAGSCPHGRPTTIRLSLEELEKQFERR